MDSVWHVRQLGNLTGRKPAGCTGTQEGNRRKHLRKTISGQGMFTDTSQIQGETKTCPDSAAADNPLCISQNFLTNIVNMSLGIEGFNVMCQSKQTQQMPENNMLYHFDYECETSTRGRLQKNFWLWLDSSVLVRSLAYQKLKATGKTVKWCINPPLIHHLNTTTILLNGIQDLKAQLFSY